MKWDGEHDGVEYEICLSENFTEDTFVIIFHDSDLSDFTIRAADLIRLENLHQFAQTIIEDGGW